MLPEPADKYGQQLLEVKLIKLAQNYRMQYVLISKYLLIYVIVYKCTLHKGGQL